MTQLNTKLLTAIDKNPVVPVITIHEASQSIDVAHALSQQGFTVLEVTLRTQAALGAIRAIKTEFPDMQVGAGTILSKGDAKKALEVGSDFLVTPATPKNLAKALLGFPVPVFPGCATATEAQTLYEMGYRVLKFFPAEANGGILALKALSAPLPHLKFMPTGGITKATSIDYLALPNVIAVGGSWMMTP